MTETKARFIRENPRYVFKQEVVSTEYLKWLEDLARKQLAYNDALQIVVGSYNLKEGDNIELPSGLKCEVIAVNAKVKDEYGHTYMLYDNEIE